MTGCDKKKLFMAFLFRTLSKLMFCDYGTQDELNFVKTHLNHCWSVGVFTVLLRS